MRENEKILLLQDYKVNKHLFDKFGIDYNKLLNKPNLSTVATTGDYEDLLNKPDLPDLPTLSTVATTGSYNDLIDKPVLSIATTTVNGLMSSADKTKLDGVKTGANKVANSTTNGNILIDNVETKVYTHPIGTNPHGTTKSDVGLGNVDNTTDLNKPISTATKAALDGKVDTSQKGVANGIAQLNSNGVVPSSQLPSYVDDVLEYASNSLFPAIGESGKIYINTTTNITYRWTGSGYAEISPSIALGETSSTAYAGDKGKTTTDKVNGHIGNANNPHGVTKAQVGLSNVPNVATNSQTPTYTVASADTALTSGEVLSTAFGKIAKAISSLISHLADKVSHITSTERTNWNNKATQSNIDASIDNIVIGGRNLILNTSTPITATGTGGTNQIGVLWAIDSNKVAGKQITVSYDAVCSTNAGTFRLQVDADPWLVGDINNTASTVKQHISRTATMSAATGYTRLLLRTDNLTGTVTISNLKIELGNKATDWTPAPEDVDSAIASKLDKTGGTLTGPINVQTGRTTLNGGLTVNGETESSGSIFCANGYGIQGRKVDGTADNLIKRISDNTIQIGSVNHSAFLHSYSTPTVVIPSGSYRVYHEGNKPLLSDLGTTIEYAKELSTVSTSTSVPPRVKKWTRLATLRITMQYQETNIQFNIMNNDASMDIITAIVSARVKQQTAMGTNPYAGVVVNGVGFNTNNFKAIITTSAAASTLNLYVAMDEDWRTFSMSKTLSANNLSALTPTQPFIDLPADAKFVPVIFK